ncbi:MAG TPA: PilZ domain-containing protein [Candidatus Polarisedimenticolaceae bacterium]|nr:PilZ domain-containing protein [Candidatus Polarisedimenticolaceae bacterium]
MQHARRARCPVEVQPTGPERHGWRVHVDTPHGVEAYGVLLAEAEGFWRARVLTYPNILWLAPGTSSALKFVAKSERDAERQALDFIHAHCRRLGYGVRFTSGGPGAGDEVPALRKVRFIPVRFGLFSLTERAGTGNLSETGLFVITTAPADAGLQLQLELKLPSSPLPLVGDVRWMTREPQLGRAPGMGIRLAPPPAAYLEYVRSLA